MDCRSEVRIYWSESSGRTEWSDAEFHFVEHDVGRCSTNSFHAFTCAELGLN